MTTVEVVYRYTTPPTESVTTALASARGVYGIRRIGIDPATRTLRIEFDATRLNAATVTSLVRLTGLEIATERPIPLASVEPASHPDPLA